MAVLFPAFPAFPAFPSFPAFPAFHSQLFEVFKGREMPFHGFVAKAALSGVTTPSRRVTP